MSTYHGARVINGVTVHRYVADNSEEEKKEIVQGVLKFCAEVKQREKKKGEENKG